MLTSSTGLVDNVSQHLDNWWKGSDFTGFYGLLSVTILRHYLVIRMLSDIYRITIAMANRG